MRHEKKIPAVGRGNLGGGLADRWKRSGHEVTRLDRDGGDVSPGPLENAALQERLLPLIFAVGEGIGPFVYRFAALDRL